MRRLRIALVVQGRFHAFDLARALRARGHEVGVFTNYPRSSATRFGVQADVLRSFVMHGVASRIAGKTGLTGTLEPVLHRAFGRWAERALGREPWDVIHCWSGVSEELLKSGRVQARVRMLMRGSTHILTQSALLEDEERRVGRGLDRPSAWMIARECREYDLADRTVVLSTFAKRSFLERGFSADRLDLLPLGVDLGAFRADGRVAEVRRQRILSGRPLSVLYVGSLSYQKGFRDLVRVMTVLKDDAFEFTLAGEGLSETADERATAFAELPRVRWVGKLPQHELPKLYHAADIFLFPTIQDGYAMVLAQAQASGLPVLATANSAAPDLVVPGRNGWIVPARDAESMVGHLRQVNASRDELARVATAAREDFRPRDWADVAEDFERLAIGSASMTSAHNGN